MYIRKKRVGKRLTSIYCGSGERGRAAEREDQERREAAKRSAEAPEVLQGATPEAADVAPAQDAVKSRDAGREVEERWARILGQPTPQRKYRSIDSFRR